MICSALTYLIQHSHNVGFYTANRALWHGASFAEPRCPFTSELQDWEADRMHEGKAGSIAHMLSGGNGFPHNHLQTHMARACFDVGVKRERDDMRSLSFWQASLANCRADMYRRFDV